MDPRTYNIRVDFTLPTIIPRIEFTKGDIGGSLISCSLFNNNKPVPVTGKTVTITLKKPDEVDVVYDLPSPNLHDNVADFYPDSNGLNVPGTVLFTVEVYDGLTRITSRRIQYVVTDSLNIEDDVASFKDYPILTGLIAQVQPVRLAEADRVIAENTREEQETIREQNEAARVQRMTELEGVSSVQFDSRLKQAETDLAENTIKFDEVDGEILDLRTNKADKNEVNSLATGKADKTYVDANLTSLDTKINSQASGSPRATFPTLTALQSDATANTVDSKKNIYLVTADGKWYYWNGSAWTAGGVYQTTGIAENSLMARQFAFPVVSGIKSKNLFDKYDVTVGYYVGNNGVLQPMPLM
jgi:hypothetical protein